MAGSSSFADRLTDTIVAIASPAGEAARAIVRLSGPRSFPTVAAVLTVPQGETGPGPSLLAPEPYTVLRGELQLPRWEVSVPALTYLMPSPWSYTREDVAEVHVVGSPPVVMALLEACLQQGVRLAQPGEFTRRALLAGRIDIAQAEAVLKLVDAPEGTAAGSAVRELTGALGARLTVLADSLFELVTQLEAAIDFSQEDIELVRPDAVATVLDEAREQIEVMLSDSRGAPLRDQPRVLLFGRANVGKSSLFNRLLGRPAALVTEHPGTTRDAVEATLVLDDLRLTLLDGAGQETDFTGLDARAARRTRELVESSDLVLHLIDSSQPLSDEDRDLASLTAGVNHLWVLSKTDLPCRLDRGQLAQLTRGEDLLPVSAVTGKGLDALGEAILSFFLTGQASAGSAAFWLNARQREALERASSTLAAARSTLRQALGEEFVAADVWEALEALGELTGRRTGDDVLDAIFSRFCIGK